MKTVIQLVTVKTGDQAVIINGNIIAKFDPQIENTNLCDLVENISTSLKVPFEVVEMDAPLDSDWGWNDILELLSPCEEDMHAACSFHHYYVQDGSVIFADENGNEFCRLTSDSSDKTDSECYEVKKSIISSINHLPTIELMNEGNNPHGYTANAALAGDSGIYQELSVCIFNKESECVADILIGLTQAGEPRVLVSTNAESDSDKITVYPMRDHSQIAPVNTIMEPNKSHENIDDLDLSCWTSDFAHAALAEGWHLTVTTNSPNPLEIHKVEPCLADHNGIFTPEIEDDRAAWKLLIEGTSLHHEMARKLISKFAKNEWMHIQEFALCLHFGINGEHADGYGFDMQENEFHLPCGTTVPVTYSQLCDERLELLIEMIEQHRQSEANKANALAVDRLTSAGYEANSEGEVISVKDPYITYEDGQQVVRSTSMAVPATDVDKFIDVRS